MVEPTEPVVLDRKLLLDVVVAPVEQLARPRINAAPTSTDTKRPIPDTRVPATPFLRLIQESVIRFIVLVFEAIATLDEYSRRFVSRA
jgi:hypothetical protein